MNAIRGLSLPLGTVVDPLASASTERRSTDMLRRETERTLERDGGRQAVQERVEGRYSEHRVERHAAFEEHQAEQNRRVRGRDERTPGAPGESLDRAEARPDEARTEDGRPAPVPGPERSPKETSAQVAPQEPEGQGDALEGQPAAPESPAVGHPAAPAAAPAGALDPALRPAASPEGPRGVTSAPVAPENASPSARTTSAEHGAAAKVRGGAPAEPSAEQAARVLQQLRAHLAHGKSHVSVDLVPAALGRVALHVAMRGGKMSAIIRAESAQTLELVERQLPELRSLLAQQGIEAERFELHLGFGEAGSRERFSFDPWKDASPVTALVGAPVEEIEGGMPAGLRNDHGGVDLYA